MNKEEQLIICKAIFQHTFWGYGGISMNICEDLQRNIPTEPSWDKVIRNNEKNWRYEYIGTVTDKEELKELLMREYQLVNYSPGEISIHRPVHHGGGLYKYIVGDWADELGKKYDGWNYGVYKRRAEAVK